MAITFHEASRSVLISNIYCSRRDRRRRLLDTIDIEELKKLKISWVRSGASKILIEEREPLERSLDNPDSLKVHLEGGSAGSIFGRPGVVVNLYSDCIDKCSASKKQVDAHINFEKEDAERRVYSTRRNSKSPRRDERHRGRSRSSSSDRHYNRSRSEYGRRSPRLYNRRSSSGSPRKQRSRLVDPQIHFEKEDAESRSYDRRDYSSRRNSKSPRRDERHRRRSRSSSTERHYNRSRRESRSPQFRNKCSRSPSRSESSRRRPTSLEKKDDHRSSRRSPSPRRRDRRTSQESLTPPRRIHTPGFRSHFADCKDIKDSHIYALSTTTVPLLTAELSPSSQEGPLIPPFFPRFMPPMMHPSPNVVVQYVPMMPMRTRFIRPPIIYNHRIIPTRTTTETITTSISSTVNQADTSNCSAVESSGTSTDT